MLKGQDMPPDPSSPKDRAREIALRVDTLYHYRENPARWQERWAVAVREEEEWHARRGAAEKRREEASQAIQRERDAIQAGGKATRRLTDLEAQPGEGWRREYVDISDPATGLPVVYVRAWMPPGTEKWSEGEWPGCNPSLSAMYLELAVLHGGVLETSPTILDSATAQTKAVGVIMARNFDDGAPSSHRVGDLDDLDDLDGPFRLQCTHQGMDRARTFLNAVKADLAKQSGRGGGVELEAGKRLPRRPPPEATPPTAGFLGVTDLAKVFHVPPEKMPALHKRLERFRNKHGNDPKYVTAVQGPGPREPHYLHAVEHVLPEIKDLTGPQ